jgi:hypothetical protein
MLIGYARRRGFDAIAIHEEGDLHGMPYIGLLARRSAAASRWPTSVFLMMNIISSSRLVETRISRGKVLDVDAKPEECGELGRKWML